MTNYISHIKVPSGIEQKVDNKLNEYISDYFKTTPFNDIKTDGSGNKTDEFITLDTGISFKDDKDCIKYVDGWFSSIFKEPSQIVDSKAMAILFISGMSDRNSNNLLGVLYLILLAIRKTSDKYGIDTTHFFEKNKNMLRNVDELNISIKGSIAKCNLFGANLDNYIKSNDTYANQDDDNYDMKVYTDGDKNKDLDFNLKKNIYKNFYRNNILKAQDDLSKDKLSAYRSAKSINRSANHKADRNVQSSFDDFVKSGEYQKVFDAAKAKVDSLNDSNVDDSSLDIAFY